MDGKPDPVNSVLSTPEVREMIMKNVDIHSLVNCRLVSKSWNITASSVLKKRPVWIKREWDWKKFDQLYGCVKRSERMSTNFPFRRLDLSTTVRQCDSLVFENATKLFTKYGRIFTHLRAQCSIKWHTEMVMNLLKKTAQLEYLELGSLHLDLKTLRPEFCLSSLHTLKLSGDFVREGERFLRHLIRAAPNLEDIQQVHCSSTVQITKLKNAMKLDLVSYMIITDFIGAGVCSELTANPPQLTELTVEVQGGCTTVNFLATFKSLLIQNARSLKKLKFCHFPVQLDDLPVFPKVEELLFEINTDRRCMYASMSAVVSRLSSSSFPKLKRVRLDTMEAKITKKVIQAYFWKVCETPLESVDKLELESYCGAPVINYFAKCFPRVTYITINYQQCKNGKGDRPDWNIWQLREFANLSKLDIIRGHTFTYGIMYRFLTGIPNETVARLRTAPKQALTPCMSEILRTHGNILQLKNLKEFTVTIEPSNSTCEPTNENPFMTMVSIWYALELIPGLRANFLCC